MIGFDRPISLFGLFGTSAESLAGRVCVMVIGLMIAGGGVLHAQTGPGGVGTTDGTSSLELWLKADQGVSGSSPITGWTDQSGNGKNASVNSGNPQLLSNINTINDKPAIEFDGDDGLSISTTNNGPLESLAGSANTVFVVSRRTGSNSNGQFIFVAGGGNNGRVVAYDFEGFNFTGYNKKEAGINPSTSSFAIGSSLFDPNGAGGNLDAVFNAGTASASNSQGQTGNAGSVFIGQSDANQNQNPYLNGDVAEVIAYSRNLNAAEIRIVLNYLAAKYDLSINGTYDYYGFGTYANDVAGIGDASSASAPGGATGPGVATSGSDTDAAESSILSLNGSVTDAFALYGHDGGDATTFTSNGNPPDAERLKRQWRMDFSGTTSSASFSATVDLSGLTLGANFDDFGLFVDSDGDFTTTADQTFYDLEGGSASGVTISDGDRIAVAQINRKVSFASTSVSGTEGSNSSTSNLSATVSVNYEDGSPIDVDFGSTADLDGDLCFNDGRTDNNADTSCDLRNDNDNFEADDGTGDEDANTGAFDGDFRVGTSQSNPATISANTSSAAITYEIDGDDLTEQTEKFEVDLTGISAGKATLGSSTTFTFFILDNDGNRDVKFADSDYTDGDTDPNYNPSSSEGNGGTSRVEKFTVKLREDGSGESAASSSPYTTVDFTVDGTSEANFGTDLSNSLVDVRIKNESGSAGTEYQERLSATSGRIHFASGAGSSTLKLEINEDGIEDDDLEDVVLNLSNPVSSTLGPDSTQTTFQISDDDGPPNVSFTSSNFSGDESVDARLNVELGQVAGTSLDVTFQDDGTGTANETGTPDDYDFPGSPTITVSSGNTSGTFTIPVNDDDVEDGDKTIDVSIASVKLTNNGATLSPGGSPKSTTYTIIDNEGIGSVGPGGVGSTDGSGNLAMWLRPDRGVFSDDACSTDATDTGNVGCWQDQSGSGNNATQSTTGNQPSFQTGVLNSQPVVRFNSGNADRLSHALTGIGAGNNTIFAVVNRTATGSQEGIFSVAPQGSEGNKRVVTARSLRFPTTDAAEALNGDGTTAVTSTNSPGTNPSILSSTFNGSIDVGVDGQTTTSTNGSVGQNGVEARIGAEIEGLGNNKGYGSTNFLEADIAEIVAYTTNLNTAQRNIVRNYLAAKYNLSPLSANELYAGDTNGDYDFNVIGIGQAGGNAHTRAKAEGVTLSVDAFNNGNYVILGTQKLSANPNKANFTNTSSSTLSLDVRADRVRFASVRDENSNGDPSFNVTYDLSDIGLKSVAGKAGNYKLLYAGVSSCTLGGCSWKDAGGSVSVSGDQITFSGATLAAGASKDYYLTIGTTDAARSPLLNPRGRTIAGNDGDGGSNLGTDAGWRYIGVPVSGATIDDLQPPISPNRNGFSTHSVAMDYQCGMNDGGCTDITSWEQLNSGDNIPNGRGFIVFLYDDKFYPVDPEIGLDVGVSNTPGSNNVTVGNGGSNGFDTALNQDSTWHLLANPYAASFDLTGNLSGPGGGDLTNSGFSSTIQLYDPSQGTYVTKTQGDAGDDVAEWQGFFVERTTQGSGDTQLTFDAAGRDAGAVDFVGSKSRSTVRYRKIGLRLLVHNDEEEVARDEAAGVYFREGATPGWDGHDASKLVPLSAEYAALAPLGVGRDSADTPKALESRPYTPSDTVVVPLRLDVEGVSGTVTVEAREWTNIPDDWTVTLVDTEEGERVPFRQHARYSFTYDGAKQTAKRRARRGAEEREGIPRPPQLRMMRRGASTASGTRTKAAAATDGPSTRLKLEVTPSAEALPVEFAELDAQTDGQSVLLQWSTASETNNAGFYVEHQRLAGDSTASPTPGAWTRSGFVDGSGTTDAPQDYRHEISGLDYGQYAFRLRQVDTDGSETISDVVNAEIRLDGSHSVSAPYPNPVRRRATLEITVREAQRVRVEVYDVLGRRVQTVYDAAVPEQETQRVRIHTDDLSSGHYFLRVQGDGFAETQRMTVVR